MSAQPAELATTSVICFNPAGQILLIQPGPASKQPPDKLTFPGGKVDPGETVRECAARELAEETGITISPGSLIQLPRTYRNVIQLRTGPTPMHWTVFAVAGITQQPVTTPEATPRWADMRDLPQLPLLANCQDAAAQAVQAIRSTGMTA